MTLPRIFVSHSHVDNDWCRDLVAALQRQGYDAWYDVKGLQAGMEWRQEIERQLEPREVFVVVLTPDAWASQWVQREITIALQMNKRVIPVILKPTPYNGFLTTIQHIKVEHKDVTLVAGEIIGTLAAPPASPVVAVPPHAPAPKHAAPHGPWTIAPNHKAITAYYEKLQALRNQGISQESGLRIAFETLLDAVSKEVAWTFIPEQSETDRNRPDGVCRDANTYPRGHWEAKGPSSDLDREIQIKLNQGYKAFNIIFENTKRGVLYQGGKRIMEVDLQKPQDLADLLRQFFTYTEPQIEEFDRAMAEFKERIPELARGLEDLIRKERTQRGLNPKFVTAFNDFHEVCRRSIDPGIGVEAVDEMLVQHLLTERIFRKIFDNADFVQRNIIANEIEKVIQALTRRAFNRDDYLRQLDRFYSAIEHATWATSEFSDKQALLNAIYERFFQGYAKDQADTHGIVYTPQPIVDFMCASVEEVLQREFGTSLSTPGVQVLDPCTGTGNFIVNLLRRIDAPNLEQKYRQDLFCNEIMLLPYYIASLNIEHAYYDRAQRYEPFEGICFADTLSMEGNQMTLFSEQNTDRIQRQRAAPIMVIIGNPPYNALQISENDNNKNRHYKDVEERIRSTYASASRATLKAQLYDPYVKFFRWASDRLQGRDGIVCFVSNNSFVDQIAFDGMRKHLLQDYTQIWHLDLHGNVRKNPKLSGTTHNVFGIQVGVGITIAIRASQNPARGLWYYRVPEDWTKLQKFNFLTEEKSNALVPWQELEPDEERSIWLTEGMRPEFATYLPMGSKTAKVASVETQTIFKTYSGGVKTNRDDWVYDFDKDILASKIRDQIEDYNAEVSRWARAGKSKDVDNFVHYEKVKWSEHLKAELMRERYGQFSETKIRHSVYRPFCRQHIYFDNLVNDRPGLFPLIFPTPASEAENAVICVSGLGHRAPFTSLMTDIIPNFTLNATDGNQCFPFYTYAEDGTNRRENITDWALTQFQVAYGPAVTKRDIFHYVYAVLHHPEYREHYAENLKRELPRIPLVGVAGTPEAREIFAAFVAAGQRLAELHTGYEQVAPYGLKQVVTSTSGFNWQVTKMALSRDRDAVQVNEHVRLEGIPPETFNYRLGNRSALEWVIDQYQISTDKRSQITTNPNRLDDPQYIANLVRRVVTVSVETMQVVAGLPGLNIDASSGSGGL